MLKVPWQGCVLLSTPSPVPSWPGCSVCMSITDAVTASTAGTAGVVMAAVVVVATHVVAAAVLALDP